MILSMLNTWYQSYRHWRLKRLYLGLGPRSRWEAGVITKYDPGPVGITLLPDERWQLYTGQIITTR